MATVVDNIFSDKDEILVVGNSPIRYPFAAVADAAPCVVRFNGSSTANMVQRFAGIAGGKVDVCALSGYEGSLREFGDLSGFLGKDIFFTRPIQAAGEDQPYNLRVTQEMADRIGTVARTISFLPQHVMDYIRNDMFVTNPTSGFCTVVYLHHFLHKRLKVVNMCLDDDLPTYTGLHQPSASLHNPAYERRLLEDMQTRFAK